MALPGSMPVQHCRWHCFSHAGKSVLSVNVHVQQSLVQLWSGWHLQLPEAMLLQLQSRCKQRRDGSADCTVQACIFGHALLHDHFVSLIVNISALLALDDIKMAESTFCWQAHELLTAANVLLLGKLLLLCFCMRRKDVPG